MSDLGVFTLFLEHWFWAIIKLFLMLYVGYTVDYYSTFNHETPVKEQNVKESTNQQKIQQTL